MASARSSKDPRELYLLKQKAVKYYEENGVPLKMEEILNSMFYEDPPDVYGHLVNFFSQFTKPPTLSKLRAIQVVDACGMPTIQTDVICTVNNTDKLLSSTTIASTNIKSRPEDREKVELELSDSVAAAVRLINSCFSVQLSGIDPRHQSEIDALVLSEIDRLRVEYLASKANEKDDETPPPPPLDEKDKKKSGKDKKDAKSETPVHTPEDKHRAKPSKSSAQPNIIPERPLEVFVTGSESVSAISQAVCSCAAAAHGIPLYRHISNIGRAKGAINEFHIPLPMVTIIQSGKSGPGKSNCIKEYMIVPGVNMPIDKSIQHIQNIYNYVAKSFANKMGSSAKFVNELGALCPTLDTPTQALDLLQEAVNAQDLTIGEDMYLAINVAANEFFEMDKGKYEIVSGTLKTSDDMVEFWADLITKYPSILAVIDPLRTQDSEAWMKLCERVSEVTYIVGDHFYARPGLLIQSEMPTPVRTSGIVMYQERMNSVSDLLNCANKLQDLNNEIIFATNQGDTTDTFIVDLAVGLNARFLKLGGPCRGERSCKINRMLQIFYELKSSEPEQREADTPGSQGVQPEAVHDKLEGLKEEDEEENENQIKDEPSLPPSRVRTGEDDKSVMTSHSQFSFPLIQNPPPPVEKEEEDGEKEGTDSPINSKRSK